LLIVIRIAPKNKQVRQTSYKLHGRNLDNVEASKYLGVTINNNLSLAKETRRWDLSAETLKTAQNRFSHFKDFTIFVTQRGVRSV
jgi:hypothetical protein